MAHSLTPSRRSLWRRLFPYAVGFLGGVLVLVLVNGVRGIVDRPPRLEPGDLYIATGTDTSTGAQRQRLLDEWNAAHPQNQAYQRTLQDSADLQHSWMVSQAQQKGNQVDVYNLDVTWIPEFASAGFIQSLTDVDTDGFLSRPLKSCQFNGSLWALPFNTDAGLLYYRTDLYGKDGADLPVRTPPSEDDMRQLAARHPAAVQAGYVTQLQRYEGLTVNALEAIWAQGGDVVSDDGRVVLDPAQAALALAPLARGTAAGAGEQPGLLPASLQDDERQSTVAFASGAVGMMRNWPVWYGHLQHWSAESPGTGFDISTHFAVRALPHSALGGQDLAISAGSTKPKAAKALIEFLTGQDSERALFGDGGLPATRTAAYHDANVLAKQPYAPVLLDALGKARTRPVTTHYPLFSDTFQDLVNQALLNGGKLPPDAVRRLTDALAGRL